MTNPAYAPVPMNGQEQATFKTDFGDIIINANNPFVVNVEIKQIDLYREADEAVEIYKRMSANTK